MANILAAPLPADLPTDWTPGQTVAPNGADAGLSQQHGYNYLMEQVNAAQSACNEIDTAVSSHIEDKDNPHGVTAEKIGALPTTGGTMTGPINMNGQGISGLPAPTSENDAARKTDVENAKIPAANIIPGTLAGKMQADPTAAETLGNAQIRDISAGTEDLTAGTSPLATGTLYFVYE